MAQGRGRRWPHPQGEQAQRRQVRPLRAQSSSRQDGPSCLHQEPLWVPVPTSSGTSQPSHTRGNRGQKWGQVRQAPWGDAVQEGSCLALPADDHPGPALPRHQCSRAEVSTPPQCRGVGWLCWGHLPRQGHEATQVHSIFMTPPTSPGGWWSQQRVQVYLGQHWAWVLRAAVWEDAPRPRWLSLAPQPDCFRQVGGVLAPGQSPGWPEDQLGAPTRHITPEMKCLTELRSWDSCFKGLLSN